MFNVDEDNETLPPGVVSREAEERALALTGTAVPAVVTEREAAVRDALFTDGKPRTKWTATEVRRLATADAWAYGESHGHLDAGTVSAVGNLLLQGMSITAVRKALGISPSTWATWFERGQGDEAGTARPITAHADTDADPLPRAPYSTLVFVVEHSQAVMELRAVKGWTGHFDRDWRAAQAFLVARAPDDWNPTTKTAIDSTSKVDISIRRPMDTAGLLEVAAILQNQGAMPRLAKAEIISNIHPEDPKEGGTWVPPTTPPPLPAGTETGHHPSQNADIHDAEIVGDSLAE